MNPRAPVLFVTWQAPESRRFFPIARVLRLPGGGYEWAYLRAVREACAHGFAGLPGLEDLEAIGVSAELPEPLSHRAPSRRGRRAASRPPVANDVLDPAPITLLVPVGSGRHERLEVFAPPLPAPLSNAWGVFMARGVGRVPGSLAAVEALAPHEPLRLEPEPDNAYNPRAIRLSRPGGAALGYVPDYLANELAEVLAPGEVASRLRVEVANVERFHSPPAEPGYQLSCRYTCDAALGERLFHSESYQPLAPTAYPL